MHEGDEGVVNAIAELTRNETEKYRIGAEDVLVHNGQIIGTALVEEPMPEPLLVHTLTGLRDYLAANRDALTLAELVVRVVSPTRAEVLGRTLATQQRPIHLRVECYDRFAAVKSFAFGQWVMHESMVIALHALFEPNADRDAILQILANVQQDAVRTDTDDGVSQAVTVRRGISMAAEQRLPNPVTLRPFRTFTEILQPQSLFVFRMKGGENAQQASVALFEADGGAWRDTATEAIHNWLQDELPEGVAVIA